MFDRKAYYLKNRAKILKQKAASRERNRDSAIEKKRVYNQEHREERAVYSREYRRLGRAKYRASYEALSAKSKVQNALKTGKLNREPCGECGKLEVEAHHDDYAHPLAIIWLCHICHMKLHRESGSYDKINAPKIHLRSLRDGLQKKFIKAPTWDAS